MNIVDKNINYVLQKAVYTEKIKNYIDDEFGIPDLKESRIASINDKNIDNFPQ